MRYLLHAVRRHLLLGFILSLLALGLLVLALATAPWSVASTGSPPGAGTPNPACGVAGVWNREVLEVLNLSQAGPGTPEPGGYSWNQLVEDNGVEMVRPSTLYTTDRHPSHWYDPDTGASRDETDGDLREWVSLHPGRTWLIGNEPDRTGQDNLIPTEYVQMYHYYYYLIMHEDPSAAIAIAGISQDPSDEGNYPDPWDWAEAALDAWEETYPNTPTMPIDVWNFHFYHFDTDYNFAQVQEPIDTWIQWIKATRNGAYASTPIWLTEWGKLDGWLDPDVRNDHIPNDQLHPRLSGLMRSWAEWMASEGKISRWFWFVSAMGDWNRNAEFDDTAWLLEEPTDYSTGQADSGTYTTLTDGDLPSPANHESWVGATLWVDRFEQGRTVSEYDPNTHTVTVSEAFKGNIRVTDAYRIFRWSYEPLTPGFLGMAYTCYCNPGMCSDVYMPLVQRYWPAGSVSGASGSYVSPLPTPDLFTSPPATPDGFLSPLPTPAPSSHFVVDDFEYRDDPVRHGWSIIDGQGAFETLNYKSDSLKLHATGASSRGVAFTYPGDPVSGQSLDAPLPFLSLDVADMDGWSVDVQVRGDDGGDYTLRYEPQFGSPALFQQGNAIILQYGIGEGYTAGSWLSFGRDLDTDLNGLLPKVHLAVVQRLTFRGPELLDNVTLGPSPFPGDTSPPTVQHLLEGTLGSHEWYTSTVSFALSAADQEGGSGMASMFRRFDKKRWRVDGGYASRTGAEGEHLLEGYAVDAAGNVGEVKAWAFYVDRTPPSIEIAEPQAVTYTQGARLTVVYTATDGVSGVDAVTAALDGLRVKSGESTDTSLLYPGGHTLVVTATDVAGWTTGRSVTFTVEVSISSLKGLVGNATGMGWFYGAQTYDLVQSLTAKLDSAQTAIEKRSPQEAENQLESFVAEVSAHAQVDMTAEAADLLTTGARYIISRLVAP